MPCPHLYRRGNILYFRLSVPLRFRPVLRMRELTQSLHTQNHKAAIPAAYRLASEAKTLFNYIDSLMDEKELSNDLLREIVETLEKEEPKAKSSGLPLSTLMALKKKDIAMDLQEQRHEKELEQALKQRELDTYRKIHSHPINAPAPQKEPAITKAVSKAPLLSVVFQQFIDGYKGKGSRGGESHKTKLNAFGKLFISYLGDKKIDQIQQKDVNEFFKLLVKYPGGRGGKPADFVKMTFLERIEYGKKNSLPLISPKNFKDGYANPANQFFDYLKNNHEDYAAPSTSHIEYEKYGGKREKGEDKQRSLKLDEIKRLMRYEETRGFIGNPKTEHQFWLPMIGLFTGARANEICQLNPQHDILKDEKTGIWFFNFTDETGGGVGVEKSHKNKASIRKVPIHSVLIDCGFLDYLDKIKSAGHDRIFIKWKPKDGKASYRAEEFFREHLRTIGLRDETPNKKILGMHCLRSTFITTAVVSMIEKSGMEKNKAMAAIRPIIGHEEGLLDEHGKSLSVTAGYVDDDALKDVMENLTDLKAIVETVDYGFPFGKR